MDRCRISKISACFALLACTMVAQVALSATPGYASCGDYLQHGTVYSGEDLSHPSRFDASSSFNRHDWRTIKGRVSVLQGLWLNLETQGSDSSVEGFFVLASFNILLPSPCSGGRCESAPRAVLPLPFINASQRDCPAWVAPLADSPWLVVDGRWSLPVSESLPLAPDVSVDAPPPRL